jgi:dinuclear metal center YbgI/SA1388 family protein
MSPRLNPPSHTVPPSEPVVNAFRVRDLVSFIEKKAPSGTAEGWDNVGLLLGDSSQEITGVTVAIDLTNEVIERARASGHNLVINHHPCIFPKGKGPSRITSGTPLFEALRGGVAVIAAHTNFDQSALEVPRAIAEKLGASLEGRLHEKPQGSLLKLVVFVPAEQAEAVRSAICAAGAGVIGRYDSCTFSTEGRGTFRGEEGTDPFVGRPGSLETADEVRLETILPRGLQKEVLRAMLEAHPYEEVAFDLYPVEQPAGEKGLVRGLGYGFWGDLANPMPLDAFVPKVFEAFEVKGGLLTPNMNASPKETLVRRIGFTPGKGTSFLGAAARAGIDLFITGEAGYHPAREAAQGGMAVLELGHPESELFFLRTVSRWIEELGLPVQEVRVPVQKFLG